MGHRTRIGLFAWEVARYNQKRVVQELDVAAYEIYIPCIEGVQIGPCGVKEANLSRTLTYDKAIFSDIQGSGVHEFAGSLPIPPDSTDQGTAIREDQHLSRLGINGV